VRTITEQQLGNYRLLHLLDAGGFADVYLAEHTYLKMLHAVKVLHMYLFSQIFAHSIPCPLPLDIAESYHKFYHVAGRSYQGACRDRRAIFFEQSSQIVLLISKFL